MFKFENVDDLKKLEKEAAFPDRLHEKTIYKSLNRVAKNFPSRPAISFQITLKLNIQIGIKILLRSPPLVALPIHGRSA